MLNAQNIMSNVTKNFLFRERSTYLYFNGSKKLFPDLYLANLRPSRKLFFLIYFLVQKVLVYRKNIAFNNKFNYTCDCLWKHDEQNLFLREKNNA